MDTARGRLLISSPGMSDENFDRTVVLMLEHTADGAFGLVVNRPAPVDIADAIPQWAPFVAEPRVLFVGGPVSQGSVLALALADDAEPSPEFTPIIGGVGILDATLDPATLDTPVEEVRLFTGYSGWGPNQLDDELARGGWFVCDLQPGDPFARVPDGLWAEVLKRDDGASAMRDQDERRRWLN